MFQCPFLPHVKFIYAGKQNYGSQPFYRGGGRGGRNFRGGRSNRCFQSGRSTVRCDHCRKNNHTVENCWDTHGRPTGGNFAQDVGGQPGGDRIAANMEEYRRNGKADNSSSMASLVQTTQPSKCLLASKRNPWIIDSGATEHMTEQEVMEQCKEGR